MRKNIPSDLLIVLIWTILTIIFINVPILSNSIIRTILGIPLVLFIPGYVLIGALFPKKDDLETIERIALSFGLSIAVVPLIGLGLNFTFGIRLIPILIVLCIYTIILIYATNYRRGKLPEGEQFKVEFSKIFETLKKEISTNTSKTDKILTIALIFSIILAIGTLIYVITVPKIGEKFTEFYILNSSSGKADNYPTKLATNISTTLMVGIVNHEYSPINYTLEIDIDKDLLKSEKLMLYNNETWEKNITFIPDKKGTDMKLEFLLFKENNFSGPYRELHLWVNST